MRWTKATARRNGKLSEPVPVRHASGVTCQAGIMRLDGIDGTWVRLTIEGYEFPSEVRSATWDSDANWLMVGGEVSQAHGLAWRFRTPSWTTGEVDELVAWLRSVARCEAPVARCEAPVADSDLSSGYVVSEWPGSHPADTGWLTFVEPNLSLAVGKYHGRQVHLLVDLAYESAPRPVDTDRPRSYRIIVVMDALRAQDAAATLEAELAAYPARSPGPNRG